MEETKVVAKPKQPKIVTRVSNIEHLQESADKLKTTSRKIRRLFEKNTYQKKTQLSVLKRYKRRLDSIDKEEEERRKKASKKKIKLPDIKKFAGSFFSPQASNDPLKAIGALAAFKSLTNLANGDILGAIAPGLVAAGMVAGPGLIGAGVGAIFNRRNVPRGFDISGKRVRKSAQQRYLNRYGEKAFKNRFGKQNLKNLSTAEPAVTGGGRAAKAFGRLGKSIIPGVGAVLGAVDAKIRADEGDITGSRIAGASATLDTLTAASAASGIGLVATPFLGLASITLDLINFARDITGMSETESKKKKGIQTKLEEQTKKQKEQVKKKEEPKTNLSFDKSLVGYEKVVTKFEEFANNFKVSQADSDVIRDAASRIEDLGAGSTPISGPGYEFTQDPSFAQYLTGDTNAPDEAYDASHGTIDNYHDHFAFKDADTARRAAAFLQSKGIEVTELQGIGGGVTGPHSGAGSAHHRGLAFDVPGYQWGGTGAIGEKEYRGSAKVRAFMNDFYAEERKRKKRNAPANQPNPPSSPRSKPSTLPRPRPGEVAPNPSTAPPPISTPPVSPESTRILNRLFNSSPKERKISSLNSPPLTVVYMPQTSFAPTQPTPPIPNNSSSFISLGTGLNNNNEQIAFNIFNT